MGGGGPRFDYIGVPWVLRENGFGWRVIEENRILKIPIPLVGELWGVEGWIGKDFSLEAIGQKRNRFFPKLILHGNKNPVRQGPWDFKVPSQSIKTFLEELTKEGEQKFGTLGWIGQEFTHIWVFGKKRPDFKFTARD